MRWLEIIELRSVGSDRYVLGSYLQQVVVGAEKQMQGKGMNSYRRVTGETDFSIRLLHGTKRIATCGSELGIRLVSVLKEFAMVNQTIWMET